MFLQICFVSKILVKNKKKQYAQLLKCGNLFKKSKCQILNKFIFSYVTITQLKSSDYIARIQSLIDISKKKFSLKLKDFRQ